MTEKEKQVLTEFLSTTLKVDAEGVASLFNEAGELQSMDVPLQLFDDKVKRFKDAEKDQYSRGKKEAMTKHERELKEKYAIQDDLTGIDLVDAIVQTHVEQAKSPEITEITKHPDYVKIKREHEKEIAAKIKEAQEKHDKLMSEFEQTKTWSTVERMALQKFDALNPVLPDDPQKATKWKQTWLRELQSKRFKVDGDQIVILNEDGTPAEDGRGNLLKFDDVVKNTAAEYFPFKVSTDRSSPGGGGKTEPPKVIKSEAEFQDAIKNASTPEERAEILKTYRNSQS